MSTIEEFENAPAGSIANTKTGLAAWREGDETDDHPWVCTTCGEWLTNENMAERDYTLVDARPLPTKDEIAEELTGWPIGTGYYQTQVAIDEARDMADAVLDLLKGQEA